jgi:hypothetical protein
MGSVVGLFLGLLTCAYFWYLSFNKKARVKLYKNTSILRWLNKSQGEAYDSIYLALIIIFNTFLSLFLLLSLISFISTYHGSK